LRHTDVAEQNGIQHVYSVQTSAGCFDRFVHRHHGCSRVLGDWKRMNGIGVIARSKLEAARSKRPND
jgi:hypothetical protein